MSMIARYQRYKLGAHNIHVVIKVSIEYWKVDSNDDAKDLVTTQSLILSCLYFLTSCISWSPKK